ncbi:NAD-dependent epimerase/dehydratase family protein [Herbidospora galbida]|uniref:NAD-dependent epimerase/dehydratase family protein n=1 Tax=Herbidospora galbida TaxID=2575442 RepID=A0A4U3MIM4_9ACTN|nr:NAD-dependent epimerase/dehydratase family protein [Herbidospora galbida]TKK88362.1 NAD-dependent epimerase/dehydratase family protein [Herbidospora galbida]
MAELSAPVAVSWRLCSAALSGTGGIVRPFNIYGPGTYAENRRVVPAFIRQALAGKH